MGVGVGEVAQPEQNHPGVHCAVVESWPGELQNDPGSQQIHALSFTACGLGLYVPAGQGYCSRYSVPSGQ